MDTAESARPAGRDPVEASLTRRDAVEVGLRLAAVVVVLYSWFLFDALVWFVSEWALTGRVLGPGVEAGWTDHLSILAVQMGPLAVRMVVAGLIWWQSPRLARWIVPREGPVFGRDSLAAEALLTVGLMLIGVYLAVTAGAALLVPAVLRFLQVVPEGELADAIPPQNPTDWTTLTLTLAAGLVLVGCRPLHRWLGRRVDGLTKIDSSSK